MLICVCVYMFICNDYDGSCFLQYLRMTHLFVFVVISLYVFFYVFLINVYFNYFIMCFCRCVWLYGMVMLLACVIL